MLDNRIYTFLKVCETMNYRVTAEQLNMTQPAVTQHIQFLEREYNCRLFNYNRKKLEKTSQAEILESYARSAVYNEREMREQLLNKPIKEVKIGATKTIGDYVINDRIFQLAEDRSIRLSLYIDNTERLLNMLEHAELDIAVVEGFFDKSRYGCTLFHNEPFVGICAKKHPFNGRTVSVDEVLNKRVILRENGSGTRAIFEQLLNERSRNISDLKDSISISSFALIKSLVKNGSGISFVYKSIADSDGELGVFSLGNEITREFNFVYLKGTEAEKYIALLK